MKVQSKNPQVVSARSLGDALRRYRLALVLAGVILLLFSGTALAAEVAGGETYVLPRGEVINDDFYVSGGEIIIDGTIEGDLVAAGGYVEINGVVTGDVIAAGGAVIVAGAVQDDVRIAGGSLVVSGSVGDDLFVAGGGMPGMPAIPMRIGERSVSQGVQVTSNAQIGGDAYIVGGQGAIGGAIGGDLFSAMGALSFAGSVAGDASLEADSLSVAENARVQGQLRYATDENITIPAAVATTIVREEVADDTPDRRNPIAGLFGWLFRTIFLILGLALLAWLLWSFARRRITEPVAAIEQRPVEAGIYGLLVAAAVLPVSAALVFLAVVFWGWFPGGLVMLAFLFGIFGLIWLISPIITGLWIGRRLAAATGMVAGDLPALLLGIVAIVLVARILALIPCVGELAFRALYLISFALAVGGTILARRRPAGGAAVRVYPSLSE